MNIRLYVRMRNVCAQQRTTNSSIQGTKANITPNVKDEVKSGNPIELNLKTLKHLDMKPIKWTFRMNIGIINDCAQQRITNSSCNQQRKIEKLSMQNSTRK